MALSREYLERMSKEDAERRNKVESLKQTMRCKLKYYGDESHDGELQKCKGISFFTTFMSPVFLHERDPKKCEEEVFERYLKCTGR